MLCETMTPRVNAVKETLAHSTVHQIWEGTYRNRESERLYELVFDWIAAREKLEGMRALDIGCGIGQHAIRLAQRGSEVTAADFSPDRVEAAKKNIERHGFSSRISVRNEDLESGLSFADAQYEVVLCWGVLMHIPQVEPAVRELVRVTRPGGRILVYEANMHGLDALSSRFSMQIKKVLGKSRVRSVQSTQFGTEYWTATAGGDLLIRHSNLRALARFFEKQGCRLRYRIGGECTERYRLGGPLARLAHLWNRAWFAAGHLPYLAHGNLLLFELCGP